MIEQKEIDQLINSFSYSPGSLNPSLNYLLARYFLSKKEFKKALPHLDLVIRSKKDKRLYEAFVEVALKIGKLSFAKKVLEEILEEKKDSGAFMNLGKIYLFENRFDQAIKCFKDALQKDPQNKEVLFLLGFSYLNLAQISSSSFDQEFVLMAKQNLQKSFGLGFLSGHKSFCEALALLNENIFVEALLKLKEKFTYLVKERKKEVFKNLDDFEKLLFLFFLDEQKIQRDSLEKIIFEYENSVENEGSSTKVHRRLGIAYLLFLKVLLGEGKRNLEIACKLDPKFEKAKTNLRILNEAEKDFNFLYSNLEFGL